MASSIPECVFRGADVLGEVPVWNPADGRIWWLDVSRALIQMLDVSTGLHEAHRLPGAAVGGWALRRSGGAVVALDTGLHGFDPDTGAGSLLAPILSPATRESHRVNEARCDQFGRLWLGTMNRRVREPTGGLHRVGGTGDVRQVLDGITIPNGICFSPDNAVMYFSDSVRKAIWAFDFDAETGDIANRRVFSDLTSEPGFPDGSAVDAEGFVWNAGFEASRILRIDPRGRIDRIVEMPTRKVTSLAFGGADLKTLFVTTASGKLTPEQLAAEPLAGALFAFEPGPRGLPEPLFAG